MNLLLVSKPSAVLAWLAAGLATGLSGVAIAQTPAPAAPAHDTTATGFRSALEGYLPYTEGKIRPWKDANDTVGRIGGWRAYAREAQQGAAPATQGAASQRDPHTGHSQAPKDKP